jgi:hypothetical protein
MTDWRMRNRPGAPIDLSQGLASIGEALDSVAAAKRQKRKDAEYARQNDLVERGQRAKDLREQTNFELQDSDRKAKTATTVAQLLAEGREGEAAALAKTSQFYDPRSGKTRGLQYDPGGQPMPPGPADNEEPLSAVASKFRLREPGAAPAGPAEELPTDYAGHMRFMGVKPQAPQQLTKPSIEGVQVDPAGERARAKEREATAQKERLMKLLDDPSIPPDLKRSIALRAGLTGAQATNVEGAQITGAEGREDAQAFTGGENEKNRANAVKVAGMRKRPGAGVSVKADDDDVFDPDTGAKLFDAPTPGQAKELNDNGRTMANVKGEFEQLKAAYAKLPTGVLESIKQGNPIGNFFLSEEEKTALQTVNRLKASITGQSSQMKGMGAPSTTELVEVQKGHVRGRGQSQESYEAAVAEAIKSLEGGWHRGLAAHGKKPGNGAPAASPDRARYEKAIAAAQAAGKTDLVKRLKAEMGGM